MVVLAWAVRCNGWLYLPKNKELVQAGRFPLVIMAHGFGQQRVSDSRKMTITSRMYLRQITWYILAGRGYVRTLGARMGEASRCWGPCPRYVAVLGRAGVMRPSVWLSGHGVPVAWQDFGLERYAERFAAAGLAVLAFDYRYEYAGGPMG
jgi:hypothetical protein